MKWEHKIGIGITCTFLCLTGAVIGLKMQEPPPESPKVAAADLEESAPPMKASPISIPLDNNLDTQPPGMRPPAPRGNASIGAPAPDSLSFDSPKQNSKDGISISTADKEKKEKSAFGISTTPGAKGDAPSQSRTNRTTSTAGGTSLPPVEASPSLPPVAGADEWNMSSNGSKEKKQNATPAAPPAGTNAVSPSLPSSPEVKKQPSVTSSTSPMIVTVGGTEPPKVQADTQAKLAPASPAPIPPPSASSGTVPPPPLPPAAANSTNNTAPPAGAMMAPYFSQQATNNPAKTPDPKNNGNAPPPQAPIAEKAPELLVPTPIPDPKDKGNTPLSPTPSPVKASEISMPAAPPAQASSPSVAAPILSPNPASSPPLPAPMSPPPAPIQNPAGVPGPTSPPKPPADGSLFLPDRSSSTSGAAGVMPAPLPLPVPPSSPLAATADRSGPPPLAVTPDTPRQASTGASVTVYDEQDYSCRAGDTWEQLSKQFYMTDRYAKALQRHNQNHARASDRIRDTGQLAAGERIFVPQAYVLEDRYADAIAKPTAAPASTTVPATFVAPSGSSPPPPPPAPLPPTNGAVSPPKP